MSRLPPLASPRALAVRLGIDDFSDEETPRIEAMLDDVSTLVREEAGLTWVDPADPAECIAPDIVRMIVLRVAGRAFRNPEGFSSESAGDYSYQRNGIGADGGLFLTQDEIKLIRKAAGKTGLWTQPLTKNEHLLTGTWLEDSFGFELFPVGNLGDYEL